MEDCTHDGSPAHVSMMQIVATACPDCGSFLHLIGTEPNGRLLWRCLEHQRVPNPGHIDLYTNITDPPPHHFDYYSTPVLGDGPLVRYGKDGAGNDTVVPGGMMNPEQRRWLLDVACWSFLRNPEDTDYLVLQSGTDWCQGIDLMFVGGEVQVEVKPRHWEPCLRCHNASIPPGAIGSLRQLGFEHGEPGTNFTCPGLSPVGPALARLTEQLFVVAYEEPADLAIGARFRHGDVAQLFLATMTQPWPLRGSPG